MARPEQQSNHWTEPDADAARDAAQRAEVAAASEILGMLTSRRSEPDLTCDGDGNPLSTAAYEGRVMWF